MLPEIERVLLEPAEIQSLVERLGREISEDYAGEEVLAVGVLNGGVFFAVDLVRTLTVPCQLDFIGASSYGDNAESGELTMTKAPSIDPKGRNVLLIEDVLDTGRTLSHLLRYYKDRGAASVKLCVLLDKPQCRMVPLTADHTGTAVGDEFIVGYGLDYAQRYRNLPYIGVLKPEVYTPSSADESKT